MQGVCVAYDMVVHMKIDLYKRTAVSTIHLCKYTHAIAKLML